MTYQNKQMKTNRVRFESRRLLAIVLCLAFSLGVIAKPITREQARQKAELFLKKTQGKFQLSAVTAARRLAPGQQDPNANVPYYVFSRGEGEGYVLVAADDRIESVLGYTDNGDFDYHAIPDNMRYWLDGYANYIVDMQKTDGPVRKEAPIHPAIQPMLTSKWSQGAPYNDECPMYFTLGRSVTGCVATAMAQILYYQRDKSVTEVQADIPGYTTWTSHATFGQLKVEGIPAGSPIDWDNMIDSYGGNATGKQKLAVAQLMHYCGVSVQMDYTNSSSGANSWRVAEAMKNYFGYGSSTRYIQQSNYSEDGWDAVIYNELEQGRVVYLSGSNSEAGHAFVADGYDGNRCYHINWGWGGMSDGYFLLSSLNPSSQGIGGSGDGYSNYQEAIIGCEPENYHEKELSIANATVKRLCVQAFDANGDGVFTYGEAAAVTDLGSVFAGQRITSFPELYYFTGLTTINDNAFKGCTSLATIKLPRALKAIGAHAFDGCRALKTFKLPETMNSIGEGAFAGCRAITEMVLPTGLTAIADSTFAGCTSITDINLPLTVRRIGSHAFAGCTKLTSFSLKTFSPENIEMGESVFDNVDLASATLNVMQGTKTYYQTTEPWKNFGTVREDRSLSGGKFTELVVNKDLYLYNEGTGRYMSMGEAWGTQAIVSDSPMRFRIQRSTTMPEGVYYLYSVDTGKDGHYFFRTSNDGNVGKGVPACFVDGGNSHLTDKTSYWTVKEVSENLYTFQIPSGQTGYKQDQYLGIQLDHASNVASPTYGAYSDVVYDLNPANCQWRLVLYDKEQDEYYKAAQTLATLLDLAQKKRLDRGFEQAVYDDTQSTLEQVLAAQHTLRKKLRFIDFKDAELRSAVVAGFDMDGDGEISFTEASKIQDFGNNFFVGRPFADLTDLQYFDNVVDIHGNSFQNNRTLTAITLPKSVKRIYYNAFRYCTKLTEITLPQGLITLGDRVFEGCSSLSSVTVLNPDPSTIEMGTNVFNNVKVATATLYVPAGSKQLYAEAPVWKLFGNIVEVRGSTPVAFSPIEPNVNGYIMNLAEGMYIANGEAYGTQAVVDFSGYVYQFRRTNSMAEGVYYLYSAEAGGNHVLFRTSNDTKVGTGVKACFVDGGEGASAYWQTVQNSEDQTFTLQVPSNDASYKKDEYLGTQIDHKSDYAPSGTNGIYWDVTATANPKAIQWAFIRQSDVLAAQAFDELVASLKVLLDKAKQKDVEHEVEQAVYDNFESTTEQVQDAVASLRQKLGYIEFADSRVKTMCTNNWDTDDDGELTYEEAAAVTDLGSTFNGAISIKSFDEFRHFTSITSLPDAAFANSSSLISIVLPPSVRTIADDAFSGCSALKYAAILSTDGVVEGAGVKLVRDGVLFVPATLKEAYQASENWNKNDITEYTGVPTVTACDTTRQYGRTLNKYTYVVSGAPINGEPVCGYESQVNEETGEVYTEAQMPVGTYPISIDKGTITTLGLQLVNGTLTVAPAELTITAKSYTRNKGEENPEFEVTYKGWRNRENAEKALTMMPTITCDATAESEGGEYEIRVSGAVAPNYTITYVSGTLTVKDPVGIDGVKDDVDEQGEWYDLQGRPIAKPVSKGIYIINGKKVAK